MPGKRGTCRRRRPPLNYLPARAASPPDQPGLARPDRPDCERRRNRATARSPRAAPARQPREVPAPTGTSPVPPRRAAAGTSPAAPANGARPAEPLTGRGAGAGAAADKSGAERSGTERGAAFGFLAGAAPRSVHLPVPPAPRPGRPPGRQLPAPVLKQAAPLESGRRANRRRFSNKNQRRRRLLRGKLTCQRSGHRRPRLGAGSRPREEARVPARRGDAADPSGAPPAGGAGRRYRAAASGASAQPRRRPRRTRRRCHCAAATGVAPLWPGTCSFRKGKTKLRITVRKEPEVP